MRIDGFSSQSYPIKRKPRKGQTLIDESVDDQDTAFESAPKPLERHLRVIVPVRLRCAHKT